MVNHTHVLQTATPILHPQSDPSAYIKFGYRLHITPKQFQLNHPFGLRQLLSSRSLNLVSTYADIEINVLILVISVVAVV